MKNFILLGLLLLSINSFSQLWFDLGIKGGLGAGFLINKSITKDSRLSAAPGMNHFYGGKLGVNFGKKHSFTIDGSFGNNEYKFIQTGIADLKQSYEYTINYKAMNLALLYRKTNDAQYIEIGPELTMLKSSIITDASTVIPPNQNAINSNLLGAVAGFGGYIVGNQTVSLSMGIRFHYIFSNLISSEYSSTNFPLTNYADITTHSTSNPLSVQILFELNFSLGQIAHASCGKRTAFIRL